MEEIRILIEVPENVTVVTGAPLGEECYKLCKGKIDEDEMNIIVFPDHVTRIIGSFYTGFFKDLRKSMSPGEIREHFSFDQQMPCKESAEHDFEKYIASNR